MSNRQGFTDPRTYRALNHREYRLSWRSSGFSQFMQFRIRPEMDLQVEVRVLYLGISTWKEKCLGGPAWSFFSTRSYHGIGREVGRPLGTYTQKARKRAWKGHPQGKLFLGAEFFWVRPPIGFLVGFFFWVPSFSDPIFWPLRGRSPSWKNFFHFRGCLPLRVEPPSPKTPPASKDQLGPNTQGGFPPREGWGLGFLVGAPKVFNLN
uniref:Melatonin receptor 1a n=1 Tax=Rusa timorensis TaxID=1088130 RepID=A0A5P9VKV8_9CERV|nr:melatonin receptor 1a [Rusa timorensis]